MKRILRGTRIRELVTQCLLCLFLSSPSGLPGYSVLKGPFSTCSPVSGNYVEGLRYRRFGVLAMVRFFFVASHGLLQ